MLRNNNFVNSLTNFKNTVKKVLICPDKFKFSLSAQEVAQTIQSSLPPYV